MKTSESIKNIALALLKAQRKMGAASKEAKNPFFKSKFADYGSVLEVVKGPLNDEGLIVLQPTVYQDGKTFVETSLVHESGEWLSGLTEVICAKVNDPQAMGAAITYSRRYGLQSFLSIPAEDTDAEGAVVRTESKKTVEPAAPGSANPWRKAKPESVAGPAGSILSTKAGGMEF